MPPLDFENSIESLKGISTIKFILPTKEEDEMTMTDPRLTQEKARVPRRDSYERRPVLSATIHPDIKRTLVAMSECTGLTVSQVADEVLYTGLLEMQELPDISE